MPKTLNIDYLFLILLAQHSTLHNTSRKLSAGRRHDNFMKLLIKSCIMRRTSASLKVVVVFCFIFLFFRVLVLRRERMYSLDLTFIRLLG